MSSLSALKYKITVNRSFYAGAIIFLLYSIVILLALFVTPFTRYSAIFYLLLFLIALHAATKSYQQTFDFLLSESGLVEIRLAGKNYNGKVSRSCFYNGLFIFLKFEGLNCGLFAKEEKQFFTIYKDAISEEQYRLLARLINNGRA